MIKENKSIKRVAGPDTIVTINRIKKAFIISWITQPAKERPMSCSKIKNDRLKNGVYLRCRLLYKPSDTGKTRYELRVLTVLYILSTTKESFKICGEFCCIVQLAWPVKQSLFDKMVYKKGLLGVVKHGVMSFIYDYRDLKKHHKQPDIAFSSLPPDKELIKCIDYKDKNKPWEYKYRSKH